MIQIIVSIVYILLVYVSAVSFYDLSASTENIPISLFMANSGITKTVSVNFMNLKGWLYNILTTQW